MLVLIRLVNKSQKIYTEVRLIALPRPIYTKFARLAPIAYAPFFGENGDGYLSLFGVAKMPYLLYFLNFDTRGVNVPYF